MPDDSPHRELSSGICQLKAAGRSDNQPRAEP